VSHGGRFEKVEIGGIKGRKVYIDDDKRLATLMDREEED
jgi:hypothetical protein